MWLGELEFVYVLGLFLSFVSFYQMIISNVLMWYGYCATMHSSKYHYIQHHLWSVSWCVTAAVRWHLYWCFPPLIWPWHFNTFLVELKLLQTSISVAPTTVEGRVPVVMFLIHPLSNFYKRQIIWWELFCFTTDIEASVHCLAWDSGHIFAFSSLVNSFFQYQHAKKFLLTAPSMCHCAMLPSRVRQHRWWYLRLCFDFRCYLHLLIGVNLLQKPWQEYNENNELLYGATDKIKFIRGSSWICWWYIV